jgi:signal transduction histidine kinase
MKRGLFLKYVVLFVGLVAGVLVINAALDMYFIYQDNKRASIEVQGEKAKAAAEKIESFVRSIEGQIGWVAQAQWASLPDEQRRYDYVRLQRQVLPITELVQLDRRGREQMRVSRLSMDMVGAGADRSEEPAFKEAMAKGVYFSPVYFRKESEPYLTMAVRHGGRSGVTVADINLKLILDVISQIKIGKDGYAYVVDRQGRLVAHPDISLVLRGTDMGKLAQVAAALSPAGGAGAPVDAYNRAGVEVLSAHATIPALDWIVFVELPISEAQQPVFDAGLRALALSILGLLIAALAGALLARRMVVPIRALQAGAQRIGSGELGHRLSIRTGDELEALADQFNRSAEALEDSYATLEQRVVDRTAELRESLEQQTATAGILQVISSSPTDVQPIFDAIARSAAQLCEGHCTLYRYDGTQIHFVASYGVDPTIVERLRANHPRALDPTSARGRAIMSGKPVHFSDLQKEEERYAGSPAATGGYRAALVVPMIREGEVIGTIYVARLEVADFSQKQIELLETFAAQAVIAIQNVRLFTELRESLEQQTATADILRVISRSPTDVQPVLDAVVKAALRFCGARDALIGLREDADNVVTRAHAGALGSTTLGLRRDLARHTALGRSIRDAATVHLSDIAQLDSDEARALWTSHNVQAAVAAPMLREGVPIGAILLRKPEPGPFTPRQVALLESFAAQAVIAIENVRLFTELRDSLEQQTATAEILEVISQSPTDVQPVLDAVVSAARRFCGADDATIVLRDGDGLVLANHEGTIEQLLGNRLPLDRSSSAGRAVLDLCTVQLADVEALDPDEYATTVGLSRQTNVRAVLAAPMILEGEAIGCVLLRKPEAGAFMPRQIDLLETFAAQAVIAIGNVRLFTEIQEKSRQLEIASQHKSQFLANMSHELRTPLNAILGYTEMMADGLYGDVGPKAAGVLERVQSNGRHLLGLINDVLDLSKIEAGQLALAIEDYSVADMVSTVTAATESLARTKNLELATAVAPGLPMGRGDARRLSQVLLNLVGNAIKFTEQGKVEIRAARAGEFFELAVVDTGFGIAPEDQKRIFDEFQQVDNTSTRKKGGTGLGLSISRKIVELHGGSITVESEIGKGSTFKVVVPINAVALKEAAQ